QSSLCSSVILQSGSAFGGIHDLGTNQVVTEGFTGLSIGDELAEQAVQYVQDVLFLDIFTVQSVHALALLIGAQPQVVAADRAADQCDFTDIRARTAIRTARHAEVQAFVPQAVPIQQRFQLVQN